MATAAEEPTTDNVLGSSSSSADAAVPEEDDPIETESVQSSTGGGDIEKENCTPKLMHDTANPFYVGSASSARQTRSSSSSSSSAKPDGSTLGNITRSRRRALGTISPWRWNAIDEQLALSSFMGMKGAKGLDPFDTTSPMKGEYAVSEWIDAIAQQKSNHTSAESASGSGTTASSSSSSSSSSSLGLATASTSASASTPSPAKNRLGALARLSSNPPSTSSAASSSSSSSSSSSIPPTLGSVPQGKGVNGKLPDHHPNSTESAERRSSLVAKMTENMIQPHSQAFNRRAQQLEGRIHYWKHGTCHLVDEQDKQQWPGEWKFDIYQDPESPEGTPPPFESSSSGSGVLETPTAAYKGKGKMTERQLSGPVTKRIKIMREPLGGLGGRATGSSSSHQEASESPMQTGSGIEQEDATPLPPSPSSRAAARRQQQQSQLQDRYDFRERRLLNGPLTSKSRR
ncbi:hypothetical protein BGX34_004165, partial [Mortierella sp. NVP85]